MVVVGGYAGDTESQGVLVFDRNKNQAPRKNATAPAHEMEKEALHSVANAVIGTDYPPE